jgi:ATP-binding cassette subfamily A (ABC1) protein 3
VLAYWVSNWIIDIIKHLIPAVICGLLVLAFGIDALIDDGNYGAVFLFFILYGWAIIPFSYACSFFFRVPGSSMMATFFIHLVFGSIISIVIYIFFLIDSTREYASNAVWVFRPIPSFSFSMGLLRTSLK